MAIEIKVRKIGMSIAPITLVEWKAKEGDPVKEGDVVLVVETEKIQQDIAAGGSGFLHIIVRENDSAPPGTVVGLVAETDEELAALQKGTPTGIKVAGPEAAVTPEAQVAVPDEARGRRGRLLISPLARKLAEEHMIDLSTVEGSGPDGRIVREDVERAIATGVGTAAMKYDGREVERTIPLVGMRRVIAEHMQRSLQVSAQLTAMGEIDAGELVKLYQSLKSQAENTGQRITYTVFVIAAVAKALRENPLVNASIIDGEIKVWKNVNVGIAVAVEGGLIVPVIKDADQKTLPEIRGKLNELTEKARKRTLVDDDIKGGTFTVSNLGALGYGWRFDTLIINQPESAILGTGGITERPAVRDGQLVIRPVMTYSFTYDHRLVDGALAAQFMGRVINSLEKPGENLKT
jgi:pyruvate dehydrogenase E2 component (dihydrolipoamide acetyltransferase)